MDDNLPAPGNASNTTGGCNSFVDMTVFVHYSLIPSVVIITILSFLHRRVNRTKLDEKLELNGRFCIIMPMDIMGQHRNRWSYAIAFGATTNTVIALFHNDYSDYFHFAAPSWAKVFVYLLCALEVGVDFYPFFCCLTTEYRLVGSALGFCYSLVWFVVQIIYMVDCQYGMDLRGSHNIRIQWPSLVCCFFLVLRFLFLFIKTILIYLGLQDDETCDTLVDAIQLHYVKRLLCKPPVITPTKSWFRRKIYDWDPYFRFPVRIHVTLVLSFICLYCTILLDFSLAKFVRSILLSMEDAIENVMKESNTTEEYNNTVNDFKMFVFIGSEAWFISTFFAAATALSYVLHIMACYRKHMKRLWRGERWFLPPKQSMSRTNLAGGVRYPGWQVAYLLWGYIILHLTYFLLAMIVAYAIVLPIMASNNALAFQSMGLLMLGVFFMISVIVAQVLICGIFFLQDKINPSDTDKPLALNNRRAYQNFSYFFFFYNVILGLSTCLFRFVASFLIGVWLIARIDRTILPRGYEVIDVGFATWIGMLKSDLYHSHPVLLVFCHHLLIGRTCRKHYSGSLQHPYNTSHESCRSSQARLRAQRRWLLLYTLLKNPKLVELRSIRSSSTQPDSCCSALARAAFSSIQWRSMELCSNLSKVPYLANINEDASSTD
uniref:stimulated by retinoic acid gene 6 protein-like n=1 Tax=Myxine glutinosa TaxID=7769 RepID=UPI00358FBD70